jgi:hypothetical protein
MTSQEFEAFLARLYVDAGFRARFLEDPRREALAAGLSEAECRALEAIDRPGLELAAASFEVKRTRKQAHANSTTYRPDRTFRGLRLL